MVTTKTTKIPMILHDNLKDISNKTGVKIQTLVEVALTGFLGYCDTPAKILNFMKQIKDQSILEETQSKEESDDGN